MSVNSIAQPLKAMNERQYVVQVGVLNNCRVCWYAHKVIILGEVLQNLIKLENPRVQAVESLWPCVEDLIIFTARAQTHALAQAHARAHTL
jgi:hypothetical protein